MTTETHFRVGSTWYKAKEIHVRDSGAWRKAKEVWVRDASSWRKVYAGWLVGFAGGMGVSESRDSLEGWVGLRGGVSFITDGTIYNWWEASLDGYNWDYGGGAFSYWGQPPTNGIGSSYWVKMVPSSGSFSTGSDSVNAWHQLNASHGWFLDSNGSVLFNAYISTTNNDSGIVASSAQYQVYIEIY